MMMAFLYIIGMFCSAVLLLFVIKGFYFLLNKMMGDRE